MKTSKFKIRTNKSAPSTPTLSHPTIFFLYSKAFVFEMIRNVGLDQGTFLTPSSLACITDDLLAPGHIGTYSFILGRSCPGDLKNDYWKLLWNAEQ